MFCNFINYVPLKIYLLKDTNNIYNKIKDWLLDIYVGKDLILSHLSLVSFFVCQISFWGYKINI